MLNDFSSTQKISNKLKINLSNRNKDVFWLSVRKGQYANCFWHHVFAVEECLKSTLNIPVQITLVIIYDAVLKFVLFFCRWRGSIYKLVWPDFAVFIVLYYVLSFVYRFALNDVAKRYDWKLWCLVACFFVILNSHSCLVCYIKIKCINLLLHVQSLLLAPSVTWSNWKNWPGKQKSKVVFVVPMSL